jgi:hypothetical protein
MVVQSILLKITSVIEMIRTGPWILNGSQLRVFQNKPSHPINLDPNGEQQRIPK